MQNIISPRCQHENCNTISWFGIPGHKPTRCARHKEDNMKRNPRKQCELKGCRELALFGITQALRCEGHQLPGDDNLVERQCNQCALVMLLNADGMCEYCNPKRQRTVRGAKEREVAQYLDVNLSDLPPNSRDRIPTDLATCGDRYRPDFLWEACHGGRVVILEVDEHGHESYPYNCEQTRMVNISQAMGAGQTVWIRYNPDRFRSGESRKWSTTRKRLDYLGRWVRHALDESATFEHTINVLYLFYDGFDSNAVAWEPLETL